MISFLGVWNLMILACIWWFVFAFLWQSWWCNMRKTQDLDFLQVLESLPIVQNTEFPSVILLLPQLWERLQELWICSSCRVETRAKETAAMFRTRASSFFTGFALASAIAMYQLQRDVMGSHRILADEVSWLFCLFLLLCSALFSRVFLPCHPLIFLPSEPCSFFLF